MITPDFSREKELVTHNYSYIAGIDEVGRGCWAGPVVAAAVIFPSQYIQNPPAEMPIIRDSKTLSAKQRQIAEAYIKEHTTWAIGEASPQEIDSIGIGKATQLAMQRAILALQTKPDYLLFDGRESVQLDIPQQSIIDGDAKIRSIAAASIIAKNYRDRLMMEYDEQYPHHSFGKHVGYGTAAHIKALKEHGITPIHRLSYKPVKALHSAT